jgi:hypothetical protein
MRGDNDADSYDHVSGEYYRKTLFWESGCLHGFLKNRKPERSVGKGCLKNCELVIKRLMMKKILIGGWLLAYWPLVLTISDWKALQFDGENRGNGESVGFFKHDDEKYAAARFLIENMHYYYAYRGEAVDSVKRALVKYNEEKVDLLEESNYWKSFNFEKMEKFMIECNHCGILINNIERAFRAWEETSIGIRRSLSMNSVN